MLPKPPAREGSLGFLLLEQFRIQGTSVAGEATAVQIPELDICFDMGACPRPMLASKVVALSHGHMDHVGGLAYYCSQRWFQGMGEGTIVCDARIENDVRGMMAGYVNLERQVTPFNLIPLKPGEEYLVKNGIGLRGFEVEHTIPSFGYSVVEKRTKLKDEYVGLPQEKLKELKDRGIDIVRPLEIPIIAYLGDTQPGAHLVADPVRKAQIVICECTFAEEEHKERAAIGMHMFVDAVAEWLRVLECKHLVLTHISRRTNLQFARERLARLVGPALMEKVHILMDYKTNKDRYDRQQIAAGVPPDEVYGVGKKPGGMRPGGRPGGGRPGGGGGFRGGPGGAGGSRFGGGAAGGGPRDGQRDSAPRSTPSTPGAAQPGPGFSPRPRPPGGGFRARAEDPRAPRRDTPSSPPPPPERDPP